METSGQTALRSRRARFPPLPTIPNETPAHPEGGHVCVEIGVRRRCRLTYGPHERAGRLRPPLVSAPRVKMGAVGVQKPTAPPVSGEGTSHTRR